MHDTNLTIRTVTDRDSWDAQVNALGGHPLQLWGWGEVKGAGAWRPHRLQVTGPDGVSPSGDMSAVSSLVSG